MREPRTVLPPRFPRLSHRGETTVIVLVGLLATCLSMMWSYHVKMRCGGDPFLSGGRSEHFPGGDPGTLLPCYSDVMQLWLGRDVDHHVFPYIHGGIRADGNIYGGVIEYPVLSGMLIYLGAIGAHTDTEFLMHTAWLLAPFGFVITVLLALMSRWWVLLWAAAPPLTLYAFHNWELPVVATTVGAIAVMAWGAAPNPHTGARRLSLRTSAVTASVLLAIGFSLKLYPGLFVLPLALYVLYRGTDVAGPHRRRDWSSCGWVVGAAALTTLLIQLPFLVLGFGGWRAAFEFQSDRKADATTNSVWYWGLRLVVGSVDGTYNSIVDIASPVLIVSAFAVAIILGRRHYTQSGAYPWVGVSASMLAGFMMFHKVHSPQYTLWLLPFFVLMNVRWQLIAAYLAADLVLDVMIFRYIGFVHYGWPSWVPIAGVSAAVWVHAVVLAVLVVTLVRTPLREPLATMMSRHTIVDIPHAVRAALPGRA